MTSLSENDLQSLAAEFGQEHVFRFWDSLDTSGRKTLLNELQEVDFPLMRRLAQQWILDTPPPETFSNIVPVPAILPDAPDLRDAWEAGEEALRAGRVGIFLVAGGQGTRLGFDGPKGAYPIGALTSKSLFEYHAEKIRNLQRHYDCTLPWYIMVSDTNGPATRAFFQRHNYFGLGEQNVRFFTQRMVPCMDENGCFLLEAPGKLARNPNGHGGSIPALVENGILQDARKRGIDLLTYFQVDNWAVKVADPRFIGYHVLHNAEMSSKNHRRNGPREAVGVHCLCDGQYRVIEYSELDIYPQLLEVDAQGNPVHYAGNPAIHVLSVEFVQRVFDHFDDFPWHKAHKKIPYIDANGNLVKPSAPNGYKFETFVFDALRYVQHPPVAVIIGREGEYTPIKQFEGDNSVTAARQNMTAMWAKWLDAAGARVPRDPENGAPAISVEISPAYALTQAEFVARTAFTHWPVHADIAIGPEGELLTPLQTS